MYLTILQIADQLGRLKSVVHYKLLKYKEKGSNDDRSGSGRSQVATDTYDHCMIKKSHMRHADTVRNLQAKLEQVVGRRVDHNDPEQAILILKFYENGPYFKYLKPLQRFNNDLVAYYNFCLWF